MLGPAAHHDLVAAEGRQGPPQGLAGLQRRAGLVEIGDLQIGPQLHLAGVGLQLAQQDLQQRRLARAIGPDDGQTVAADHPGREALQHRPLAERLGDRIGLQHPLARGAPRVQAHRERAPGRAQAHGLLFAQRHQPAQASLVAGAPGGDAPRQPVGLALQLLVELAGDLGLGVGDLLHPAVEVGEALVQAAHLPALQPETGPRHMLQEGAVVADDQQGRAAGFEPRLQGFDGQDVQVVGRLVQQQHLRVLGEGPRQSRAADFPTRQADGRPLGIEPEGVQLRLGPVRRRSARGRVVDQLRPGDGRLLGHPDHPRRGLQRAFPGIRLGLAGQHPQQGRLARAVAADQAGTRAGLQRQVDPVEQLMAAVLQAHGLQRQDRGTAHRAPSPRAALAKSWARPL